MGRLLCSLTLLLTGVRLVLGMEEPTLAPVEHAPFAVADVTGEKPILPTILPAKDEWMLPPMKGSALDPSPERSQFWFSSDCLLWHMTDHPVALPMVTGDYVGSFRAVRPMGMGLLLYGGNLGGTSCPTCKPCCRGR